jgi:hypothetical protein
VGGVAHLFEALHHGILCCVARAKVLHGLVLFVALVKRLDHVDASRMQVQRQSGMHRAKLTSGVIAKIHKSVSVEVVTERSRERLCAPREIERLGQTVDTFVNVANNVPSSIVLVTRA